MQNGTAVLTSASGLRGVDGGDFAAWYEQNSEYYEDDDDDDDD